MNSVSLLSSFHLVSHVIFVIGCRTSQHLACLLALSSLLAVDPAPAHPVPMPQTSEKSVKVGPTESEHLKGPAGLQGWTLNYPFPDRPQERYPRILVIAQNGRVIRHISGQHYIWKWIFWNGGRQVAYEDGPPHFIMRCILLDLKTGHEVGNYDCFSGLPKDSPLWLESLENVGK
jgi:hypothetical protein